MLSQLLQLACGHIGSGITPEASARILVVQPEGGGMVDLAKLQAVSATLLANEARWGNPSRRLPAHDLEQGQSRIICRTITPTVRGKKFARAVRALTDEVKPDIVVVHLAKMHFGSISDATRQLSKFLPVHVPPQPSETSVPTASVSPPPAPHNAAIFAPSIVLDGMPDDEGGPLAWTLHYPRTIDFLFDAARCAAGVDGFFRNSRPQQVTIFSSCLMDDRDRQSVIAWLSRHTKRPSDACRALQRVCWIPLTRGISLADLSSLVTKETKDWAQDEKANKVVALWKLEELTLTPANAVRLLLEATLGPGAALPD